MTSVQSRSNNPFNATLAEYTFAMDSPGLPKREDGFPIGRHVRSSSDPISRGGNFSLDGAVGAHLLDAEPNPFERSFSGPDPRGGNAQGDSTVAAPARRARSISPNSLVPRATPGGTQKLPPLSLIQTPSHELQNFGWGSDSLRTGPLSPALLNGPAQHGNMFDGRRTGLTPMGGSVSFPPPSPATAALFAMMTNNTPGTAEGAALAGGGPRPHEGPNESNHFEASFASSGKGGAVSSARDGQQDFAPQQPANGGARGALANNLNGQAGRSIAPQTMLPSHMANQQPPPQTSYFPTQPAPDMYQQQQQQQQQQQYPGYPPQPNIPQQPAGSQPPYGNQNPLYLLSQASGHTDDAVVAAAALSGLATPGGSYGPPSSMDQMLAAQQQQQQQSGVMPGMTAGGSAGSGDNGQSPASSSNGPTPAANKVQPKRGGAGKRKKSETAAVEEKKPPAKKGRRGAAAKVDKDEDEDFDDGSKPEQSMSPVSHNANETEEEKRKNFLERNRQAALKCRQRKKAWLANLQSKVEMLTTDNDTLQSTVTNLKEEIQSLRAILQAHANCPVAATAPGGRGPVPGGQGYPSNGQPRY